MTKEYDIEKAIGNYMDDIRLMLSPKIWENLLLDCTKNELFILWLLYRHKEVNMTQIAEYVNVPLNTATGIISRMEKRNLVLRQRSIEDKRVVTIRLDSKGTEQINSIIKEAMRYSSSLIKAFTKEEIEIFLDILKRGMEVLKKESFKDKNKRTIKKINID